MRLILAISLLLQLTTGLIFDNGAVITSSDVSGSMGVYKPNLKGNFRVYGVYAGYDQAGLTYADKVEVAGANGITVTLSKLAVAKPTTGYILDNSLLLMAPITITDKNAPNAKAIAPRIPYTIYLASTDVPVSPVVSAQLAYTSISTDMFPAVSCTILSAEPNFQISGIDTSQASTISVTTSGYDTSMAPVMTVFSADLAPSSLLVPGPIATLWNSVGAPATFSFTLKTNAPYSGSLLPGASTTFLSDGWVSQVASYQTMYQPNDLVRWRSVDFGKETVVNFSAENGNFRAGDSFKISCVNGNGKSTEYDGLVQPGQIRADNCKTISMAIGSGAPDPFYPLRFKLQIVSASSTVSLFAALILAAFGILVR